MPAVVVAKLALVILVGSPVRGGVRRTIGAASGRSIGGLPLALAIAAGLIGGITQHGRSCCADRRGRSGPAGDCRTDLFDIARDIG